MTNSSHERREQGQNTTEILRTKARKHVARYVRRKYSGNKLAFIAGDVFAKVQEPYRLWAEQGNRLDTDQDYGRFIDFVKSLPWSDQQNMAQ